MTLKHEIYTPQELASELRVGKRMILKAIAKGRLEARKLSRNAFRIWREDALTWLEDHCDPGFDADCGEGSPDSPKGW